MVGQMLASEALNATIVRPLLPTDRKAIEFLDHYTFNELNSAFEDLKTNLRQKLIEGVQQGLNPDEVARQLGSELKDYDTDLALIAITETARGESQGRLHELLDAGFEYAIGSSAHDSRVCEQCLELVNGVTVRIEDTLGVTNYGRKRDAWVSCIPLHPRCRCVWLPWTRESDKLINAIQ
jgi:SPP1 gp7 family putative phage head morphogenesis protein